MTRIQFYNAIAIGIDRYLPEEYRKMPKTIRETEVVGMKMAFLAGEDKNGKYLSPLNLEPYWMRLQEGDDIYKVVKDMAEDYVKKTSPSKQKNPNIREER